MLPIKQRLYDYCQRYITQRIDTARQAIQAAQAAANEETKSSSGDKYETGRSMMQLEIEKNSVQLAEANKSRAILDRIKIDQHSPIIQSGSLVVTNNGNFFIAISVGHVMVDDTNYIVVSPQSPVGAQLLGKQAGLTIALGDKTYVIEQVY